MDLNKLDKCVAMKVTNIFLLKRRYQGRLVAHLVERLTLAQVMISQFVSSSPTSDSMLTAQSLEIASDSVSLALSAPPPLVLFLKNK